MDQGTLTSRSRTRERLGLHNTSPAAKWRLAVRAKRSLPERLTAPGRRSSSLLRAQDNCRSNLRNESRTRLVHQARLIRGLVSQTDYGGIPDRGRGFQCDLAPSSSLDRPTFCAWLWRSVTKVRAVAPTPHPVGGRTAVTPPVRLFEPVIAEGSGRRSSAAMAEEKAVAAAPDLLAALGVVLDNEPRRGTLARLARALREMLTPRRSITRRATTNSWSWTGSPSSASASTTCCRSSATPSSSTYPINASPPCRSWPGWSSSTSTAGFPGGEYPPVNPRCHGIR